MIDGTLPFVIGHRGASGSAPENTAAAARRARSLGARWIEADVQLAGDGVPVVIHDHTLERTTDGHGPVADRSARQLARLDAGGWFSSDYAGERIPTFAEMLAVCRDTSLGLNVELKPNRGAELTTARAVAAELHNVDQPLLVSSFSTPAIASFHDAAPRLPLGALFREPPQDGALVSLGLSFYSIHLAANTVRETDVVRLRHAGYRVLVYTVNDVATGSRLRDWGVTAIFTDYPDRFAALNSA